MSGTEKLQERIGYRFEDPTLLEQAVTHRSYSNANNERLEFLGVDEVAQAMCRCVRGRFSLWCVGRGACVSKECVADDFGIV